MSSSKQTRHGSTVFASPDHSVLRIGTLNAILKAVAKAQDVEKESILRHITYRAPQLFERPFPDRPPVDQQCPLGCLP